MTALLPLFYFKPTICWVDDDQLFLDAVNVSFKEYHSITFNCPRSALEYFNQYQSPLSKIELKREFRESDIYGTNDHYPVDIIIPNIKNLLSLPKKENEVAVLVIDYNMPEMNGLEICEKLKSLPMKKILLTGEATHEKAIDAFNRGLINKFIKKDHNTSDLMQEYLDELTYQYFYEKTSDLISHIEASKPSLLSDSIFIKSFSTWCLNNQIVEFYLINKHGSFLAKNKDGKLAYFVIMSETDKNEFIALNDELIDKAGLLLNQVSQGKMIPFFGFGKESWDIDPHEWKNHFYPAQVISGRESYYWTVIEE